MNNYAAQPSMDWMPDLGRELLHWRHSYPDRPYFKSGLEFERYIATFKFGYDTFLLNRGQDCPTLLSTLCHRYKDGVAACDRIDWIEAEMIISATWARLEDSASVRASIKL